MNLLQFLHRQPAQLCRKVNLKGFHVSSYGAVPTSALQEIRFRPFEKLIKVSPKKSKRPPFAARFFRGQIDEDLFTYPEVISEQLKRMKDMASVVQGLYSTSQKELDTSSQNKISDNMLNKLKSVGLFGIQVPQLYGGLELSAFEMNYVMEAVSQNSSIFHMLNFHNIYGVNIVVEAGTEAQKQVFLPRLASGDSTFSACIWEDGAGSDLLRIKTVATPLDSDLFLLSGTKIWVNNTDNADFFLVLANTAKRQVLGDPTLTFFIVAKDTPGITVKPIEKNGVEQLSMSEVSFKDVLIKSENIIGGEGKGFEIANRASLGYGSHVPCAVVQMLRLLEDKVTQYVIHREQFGQPLFNFNLIKWKLVETSMRLYVLESMAYLTAGLRDEYDDQDTIVESAATKVFAIETLQYCLDAFSDIFAGRLIEKDFELISCWKDAPFMSVCEGTKDMLKMHITLNSLRLMTELEQEQRRVKQLRNPLQFPTEKLRDLLHCIRQSKDKPKVKSLISHNLHPSLQVAADTLEYCIYRLQWAVDLNIVHAGAEITRNQHVMVGLADIGIECYAMTAALARASRSYCIGLKNAEAEMMTAFTYVSKTVGKIRQLTEFLDPHNPPVDFTTIAKIAEIIGSSKGYFAQHPTERNYD